jgi:hypothetical protein
MGWLYLLRDLGLLGAGPKLSGALPFEQLARADDQPLLRVVFAWLPAGAVAGLALARSGATHPVRRGLALAGLCLVVLVLTGAVADAVAISSSDVAGRLPDQATHAGMWTETALVVIGSLAARSRPSTAPPAACGPARAS